MFAGCFPWISAALSGIQWETCSPVSGGACATQQPPLPFLNRGAELVIEMELGTSDSV